MFNIKRPDAQWQAFRFAQQSCLKGYYAEFGVWQGQSMFTAIQNNEKLKDFCKRYNKDNSFDCLGFVGYDSFDGFPEFEDGDELEGYTAFYQGKFKDTSYDEICEAIPRARFVKGYFNESFKDEPDYPIAIAHIDCDIYSSTVDVLNFITPRLVDGAVLLWDDWFCYQGRPDKGERRAFLEWDKKDNCQDYFNYAQQGKAMIYSSVAP